MRSLQSAVVAMPATSVIATNKLIRNTYTLLAMTLLFSAMTAGLSMAVGAPYLGVLPTLIGYFGLLYLTTRLRNSAWGIAAVFALTGFMGFTLGPILSMYLTAFQNGAQLVMLAMGGTGAIFLGLSAYTLQTRSNFSYMGGFLTAGVLVAFFAGLGAIFFQVPALMIAVSAMFVLLMAGMILYQTSELVHGGETNYILATVGLYVSIYNLFTSLLQLLGVFGGDD